MVVDKGVRRLPFPVNTASRAAITVRSQHSVSWCTSSSNDTSPSHFAPQTSKTNREKKDDRLCLLTPSSFSPRKARRISPQQKRSSANRLLRRLTSIIIADSSELLSGSGFHSNARASRAVLKSQPSWSKAVLILLSLYYPRVCMCVASSALGICVSSSPSKIPIFVFLICRDLMSARKECTSCPGLLHFITSSPT